MSNPERLCLDGPTGLPEELVVTMYDEGMDVMRDVAVPRERDLAEALSRASDEWFERFLLSFQRKSPNRAFAVARAAERAQLNADVAGGDTDPGFGVSPEDSARLLELRVAIDTHLGWNNHKEEAAGDYLGRIRQVGELLFERLKLTQKMQRMRKELKRLNRAERERSLTVSLSRHQHAVYLDPQAERRRIAHLVWSVAQLLERQPTQFTDRSLAELREALSAWHQRLVAP